MKVRAYLLFSLGLALLAFALVNTALYSPPNTPRHIGNGIQRIEP